MLEKCFIAEVDSNDSLCFFLLTGRSCFTLWDARNGKLYFFPSLQYMYSLHAVLRLFCPFYTIIDFFCCSVALFWNSGTNEDRKIYPAGEETIKAYLLFSSKSSATGGHDKRMVESPLYHLSRHGITFSVKKKKKKKTFKFSQNLSFAILGGLWSWITWQCWEENRQLKLGMSTSS